jgi:hypothetical protein
VYAASPLYDEIRRIHFGIMTPVMLAATIALFVIQQWIIGALALVAASIFTVGALRTPGSYLRRWTNRD